MGAQSLIKAIEESRKEDIDGIRHSFKLMYKRTVLYDYDTSAEHYFGSLLLTLDEEDLEYLYNKYLPKVEEEEQDKLGAERTQEGKEIEKEIKSLLNKLKSIGGSLRDERLD